MEEEVVVEEEDKLPIVSIPARSNFFNPVGNYYAVTKLLNSCEIILRLSQS
jgi:hypothetical protein